MIPKLTDHELQTALSRLPNWNLEHGELVQTLAFKDFVEAITFVNRIATLAESAKHHPDIDIRYNRVRLTLSTHDSGGITANDTTFAALVDSQK
jgi:4a-hydroxytetrahydrobiopterin dehydratase